MQGLERSTSEQYLLTTAIEGKQYLLRGNFRVDVGDYKGRVVGKQQDYFELLLPDGRVRKYKIVRVGPILDYSYKPSPEPTTSASADTAAPPAAPAVQPDHVEVLQCVGWMSDIDDYRTLRILNSCPQEVSIWWGPYDRHSDSGKMTNSKRNVKPGEWATAIDIKGDLYATACPVGHKLSYKANAQKTVKEWAHKYSLECVLSPGY